MQRYFNTEGACFPQEHYMVDLTSRLVEIKTYIDRGKYFTINRGRQYGKTTMLSALTSYLKKDYAVIYLDFQFLDNSDYESTSTFVHAFARESLLVEDFTSCATAQIQSEFERLSDENKRYTFANLFVVLSAWCKNSEKPIVLIIDEVDSASNNQVFLDFLAQLRGYYLHRHNRSTFQSVILAGVHDIRNLRQKIRPDSEHKHNSPWNIAAEFNVRMSFNKDDIAGMLQDYENDHHTGMQVLKVAEWIYDYTSGYPVLVSALCKIMDEQLQDWSRDSFLEAVKLLLIKPMPLFESLINKLEDNAMLRNLIQSILFQGISISYNPDDDSIQNAAMYGFVRNNHGTVAISNRIFEVRIYNWLLIQNQHQEQMTLSGSGDRSQFIENGKLNMERILEKFVQHFEEIYGSQPDKFKESDGRKLFLLYLRPIINGTGNYYIEAQTRDQKRTDVIVDYAGEQFVIELKIWHGEEYNTSGEQQIAEYLDYYHLEKGYLLSFNFNQKKQIGTHTIIVNGKAIVEAVV